MYIIEKYLTRRSLFSISVIGIGLYFIILLLFDFFIIQDEIIIIGIPLTYDSIAFIRFIIYLPFFILIVSSPIIVLLLVLIYLIVNLNPLSIPPDTTLYQCVFSQLIFYGPLKVIIPEFEEEASTISHSVDLVNNQ